MIARYLRLVFWPSDLVVNYGPPVPLTLADVWPYALPIVVLLLLSIAALRSKPQVGFLGVWLFVDARAGVEHCPGRDTGRRRAADVSAVDGGRRGAGGGRLRSRLAPTPCVARGCARSCWLSCRSHLAWRRWRGIGNMRPRWCWPKPCCVAGRPTWLTAWSVPSSRACNATTRPSRTCARAREAIRRRATTSASRSSIPDALTRPSHELEILVAQHPLREEVPWSRRLIGQAYAAQQKRPEAIAEFRTRAGDDTRRRSRAEPLD